MDALGGFEDDIAGADGGDEEVAEFTPTLYKLPRNGGPEMIAEGEPVKIGWGKPTPKIDRSTLDTSDVFLLGAGWELFVWQGNESDRSECLQSMAQVYGQISLRQRQLYTTSYIMISMP
jgi:hypothetical protein